MPDHNVPQAKADTLAVLQGGKKVKSEVNYRPANSEIKMCHTCTNYQNTSAESSPCSKVVGMVSSSAVCDLWSARNEQTPAAPESGSHHLAIRIHTGLNSGSLNRILTENPEG